VRPPPISIGKISLSPSRRLTVVLRHVLGEPSPILDARLQISDGQRWIATKYGLRIESERLPELLSVIEQAIERLPEL
jgi:hypothetical protein